MWWKIKNIYSRRPLVILSVIIIVPMIIIGTIYNSFINALQLLELYLNDFEKDVKDMWNE